MAEFQRPVSSASKAFQAAMKRAGITQHVRPYDLRHKVGDSRGGTHLGRLIGIALLVVVLLILWKVW